MQFDFDDEGEGPAILFIPGSYSTGIAWRGIRKHLRGRYRTITTSLPGYGGTFDPRNDDTRDMGRMNDFVAELAQRVGAPVHIVGHSFGASSILSALHVGAIAPASLITFEANPVGLRPPEGAYPWQARVAQLVRDLEDAVAGGDPDAPGLIIDYWGRPGTFAALPEPVQSYCRETVRSNLRDWRSGMGFTPALTDFAACALPSTIVRGEHANAAIVDLSRDLAGQLGSGSVEVVAGADHFLISTHPADCAALIDAHMNALTDTKAVAKLTRGNPDD